MSFNWLRRFLHFNLGLTFVQPDATGKVLLTAKELIEKRGWTQHQYVDDQNKICSLQAFWEIESSPGINLHTYEARRRFLKVNGIGNMAEWNDTHGRKIEHILAAFERAAWY